ncbi:hypothetical protein ACWDG1_50320, partial [Streptomyces sp. NPDC001177]
GCPPASPRPAGATPATAPARRQPPSSSAAPAGPAPGTPPAQRGTGSARPRFSDGPAALLPDHSTPPPRADLHERMRQAEALRRMRAQWQTEDGVGDGEDE